MQTPAVNLSISSSTNKEEQLKKILDKKKKTLAVILKRYDALFATITGIQEEYAKRVGRLYRKDLILDGEIIRLKKIVDLMAVGFSYEEAVAVVDKADKERKQEEQEEFFSIAEEEKTQEPIEDEVKKLWKKLVQAFHPDLTRSREDKRYREKMMKKINNAYKANDFNTLKAIEERQLLVGETIVEKNSLEQLYVAVENALIRIRKDMQELRKSEWFSWIKKSKDEKEYLFCEMEQKIMEDIAYKTMQLRFIKRKYNID